MGAQAGNRGTLAGARASLARLLAGGALLTLLLSPGTTPAAAEEPLSILYFNRPPLYVALPGGRAGGLLLEKVERIFRRAQVPYLTREVPVKRILDELKWGKNACGIGWFKTSEREAYAIFSEPVARDHPYSLVINRRKAEALPPRPDLEMVLARGLNMGMVDGFTYGPLVDDLVAKLRPATTKATGSTFNLLGMIALGRCDFTLADTLEAAWLLGRDLQLASKLEIRPLASAPPGNLRHIMFSKKVDPAVIERINRAIAEINREEGLVFDLGSLGYCFGLIPEADR